MSGSVTAAAGQTLITPNPPSQQPSPSPAATPQVNAWGWPSGFNQPSPASTAAGPSRPQSFAGAMNASPALVTATMFTPQPQQLNHQHQQHQQHQAQLQLQHLQHPHHQQHPQHPQQQQQQQPPHLQHQFGQQQQHNPHVQQLQQQSQQQQQQGPQPTANQAKATVYPPQPYGQPPAFTGPNHTSSPNSAAKPNTPNSHSVMMSKKRTASKSPEFENKDKRSRPEDGVSGDNKVDGLSHSGPVSDGRVWGEEATKLDVYVWDYLSRRGFNTAAKALMNEAGMTEPPEVPLKTPQGLLFEYWAIFWDVFAARSGRGGNEAAAYFEYQESRNTQRLQEANRKIEALEAQYQAPENGSRFPNIVVSGINADPTAAGNVGVPNGRPSAAGAWNPAALPPAQQHQLLITAAQRQNIPLQEIKNLTPASRMALINSMNPNNPANAQAVRPGMNNQVMEQQLQARLQQQQALHRMMQQQRQAGGQGPMPSGVPGASPVNNAMQGRPPMGPQQMPGAGGSPAPPTPGGPMDGRRSVGPGAEGQRPEHMAGPPGALGAGNPQSQPQQPPTPGGGPQQIQQQQPGQGPPQPGQGPQQQHPQLNPHQQQLVMNQFQSVQAAMREEWMKAQNAPNQTTAADFYANVQAYQAKAQGLQNLLRAQANYQGGASGPPGNGAQAGMPGQPGPSPQARPPGMPGPAAAGSPASMAHMTPQQRAAQIANQQAAAGRITPLMATHDPGLMASMMGPNSMPNGTAVRPNAGPQQGGPGQQPQQQQQGGQLGQPGSAGGFQQPQQPQQQMQGPARPPSAQGAHDDPNTSHFTSAQIGSSPVGVQRPVMQRASSQLGSNAGGMGPPGAGSISSPSPRIAASNLQQQQTGGNNNSTNANSNPTQGGSPAPANVPNTPKLGSAEKGKKGNARQRKNSKATTKTPVLTAASVPGANSSAPAVASTNGAPGPSTPAAANDATPASASAATPGRDATAKPDGNASNAGPQPTSQPIDATMPPPAGPPSNAADGNNFGGAADNNGSNTNGQSSMDGSGAGVDGSGAGGSGNAEDFSMFGFGGSMNDIFDFDLSTDGTGGQGLGGDGWDSNFGNLFGSGTGGQDGS